MPNLLSLLSTAGEAPQLSAWALRKWQDRPSMNCVDQRRHGDVPGEQSHDEDFPAGQARGKQSLRPLDRAKRMLATAAKTASLSCSFLRAALRTR